MVIMQCQVLSGQTSQPASPIYLAAAFAAASSDIALITCLLCTECLSESGQGRCAAVRSNAQLFRASISSGNLM
jgi:hypothetical protein